MGKPQQTQVTKGTQVQLNSLLKDCIPLQSSVLLSFPFVSIPIFSFLFKPLESARSERIICFVSSRPLFVLAKMKKSSRETARGALFARTEQIARPKPREAPLTAKSMFDISFSTLSSTSPNKKCKTMEDGGDQTKCRKERMKTDPIKNSKKGIPTQIRASNRCPYRLPKLLPSFSSEQNRIHNDLVNTHNLQAHTRRRSDNGKKCLRRPD